MKTFHITLTYDVEVKLDESKLTPEFMAEYRKSFCDFGTLEEHAKHLAQLYVNGCIQSSASHVEGYGELDEMGIELACTDIEVEAVDA